MAGDPDKGRKGGPVKGAFSEWRVMRSSAKGPKFAGLMSGGQSQELIQPSSVNLITLQ
jgi:hypothetical protein